jgi:primosomal protein N'
MTVNTETEAVSQEVLENIDEAQQNNVDVSTDNVDQPQEQEETKVPLSALQKERKKRQEAEQRAKVFEDIYSKQNQAPQPVENNDQYEAVTKADLKKFETKALRTVDEKSWIKSNPEKVEEINEKLTEFLKVRPHLALAIENAPNRYEEAWLLMNALTPKQKIDLKSASKLQKKSDAPASPTSVPKAAGINQAVDVFNMTDAEFIAHRKSIKGRR